MKIAWILILLIFPRIADAAFFPDQIFKFSAEYIDSASQHHSIPDSQRIQILQSLSKSNRDQILAKFVPHHLVGGETWFDLRGIEVRRGDLTAKANLTRICWDYALFKDVDLSGAELNGTLMRGATFEHVKFISTQIDSANMQSSDFRNCNLTNVNFRMTQFDSRTSFRFCAFDYARFDNCKNLTGVIFSNCSMKNTVFDNSNLTAAQFIVDDLTGSSFVDANLSGVDFYRSKLISIDLTEAILSNAKLHEATLNGSLRLIRTQLSGAFLGDIDISKIDMSYVNWHSQNYFIGEEIEADKLDSNDGSRSSHNDKQKLYSQAELIYRVLADKYRRSGQLGEYLELRYRSLETRRKLLSLQGGDRLSLEYFWLNISKLVDGYGTHVKNLLLTLVSTVLAFACIYLFGWTFLDQHWVEWFITQPDGKGFLIHNGCIVKGQNKTPQDSFKKYLGWDWQRLLVFLRLFVTAIWFSIESVFMFAENVLSIPDILNLLRVNQERLLPVGFGRILVGIEAFMGVVLFFFAARMILLVIGL